jgi:hypothetical protein
MHVDGRITDVPVPERGTFTLAELQKVIGGLVNYLPIRGDRFMVVDEEGDPNCKNLPLNMGAMVLAVHPIYGDALVVLKEYMPS